MIQVIFAYYLQIQYMNTNDLRIYFIARLYFCKELFEYLNMFTLTTFLILLNVKKTFIQIQLTFTPLTKIYIMER